jgi:hypothetical protein
VRHSLACSSMYCLCRASATVVHCIRLIAAAVDVWAVAEVVLAAVELSRIEWSSRTASCVVQLQPKLTGC